MHLIIHFIIVKISRSVLSILFHWIGYLVLLWFSLPFQRFLGLSALLFIVFSWCFSFSVTSAEVLLLITRCCLFYCCRDLKVESIQLLSSPRPSFSMWARRRSWSFLGFSDRHEHIIFISFNLDGTKAYVPSFLHWSFQSKIFF